MIDGQTKEGTLQIQGVAEFLKPNTSNDPNLKITPKFLIFKKKEESGKTVILELKL